MVSTVSALVLLVLGLLVTDIYSAVVRPTLGLEEDDRPTTARREPPAPQPTRLRSPSSEYVREVAQYDLWNGKPSIFFDAIAFLDRAEDDPGVWSRKWDEGRNPILSVARIVGDAAVFADQPAAVIGRVVSDAAIEKDGGSVTREVQLEDLSSADRPHPELLYCRYRETAPSSPLELGETVFVFGIPLMVGTVNLLPSGRGEAAYFSCGQPKRFPRPGTKADKALKFLPRALESGGGLIREPADGP